MQWFTASMNVELKEDGILLIHPPTDFKGPETIEYARENIDLLRNEIGIDRVLGIIAHMPAHYVNAEASRHYRKNAPPVPTAMVADSFFTRMMGNFLLALNSRERPMKLFATEAEGRQWVREKVASSR